MSDAIPSRVWIEHDQFGGDREWKGGPPCWYCDIGLEDADCTCLEDTDETAARRIRIGAGHWKDVGRSEDTA